MKKIHYFLLGLMLVLSPTLISCSEDDDEKQWGESKTGYHNGYEYIDLGLPSGLKWATHNVGASSPEEYGDYYAWGETEEKSNYDWSTYKWYKGTSNSMTKYCTDSYYGRVDNKTVLEPSDDVAHIKWGGSWRMPTKEEFQELIDNCTWKWTTYKGTKGYKVTSKKNGNSIFLPAAGYRYGTELIHRGLFGSYRPSSLYVDHCSEAWELYFGGADCCWFGFLRYYGCSVRPVVEYSSNDDENTGNDDNENDDSGDNPGGGSSSSYEKPDVGFYDFTATRTSLKVQYKIYNKSEAGVTSARIYYGTSSNPTSSKSATVSGTLATANISGLKAGTTYYVKCVVKGKGGTTTTSTTRVTTNF